jgi:pimeloyl-ACP methyl ester carboxylesterase
MKTITSADGTSIAFERTGSGPPLVLVHGTSGNHSRWDSIRPALAEQCSVYAIDRRGCGESGDAAEYALDREVEDIAAVVESIEAPVHLLGHSYGALCVLEAALRIDDLRTLILYEPVFAVGEDRLYSDELLAEMEALLEEGENERVLVMLFEEIASLSPAEMEATRSAPTWESRVEAAHTVLRETLAENEYVFHPDRFDGMTTPTLLLSGSENPQWIRDSTETLEEALPNSWILVFEGHGHMAMNSASDRFVNEVLAFIRESTW